MSQPESWTNKETQAKAKQEIRRTDLQVSESIYWYIYILSYR